MRIVFNILGTFNSGGMERVLANKANYLANHGFSVTIITTDQKGRKPYFDLDSTINTIDLDINYKDNVKGGVFLKVLSYLQKQRKHLKTLRKQLISLKADIVVSMFDNDASLLYKIDDGSKKILEVHFSRFKRLQYNRKGILGLIDKYRSDQDLKIASQYDRFIVLTEEDKGYWGDLANIQVVPNANSFKPVLSSALDNRKVIAVGRLDYQKGFDDLIRAWKSVAAINPEWILNIYGEGPLKNQLKVLIDSLELHNSVFLQEPTNEIEEAYCEHSILAMTSRYEGLPMVLLEAQSCGLPLVSYACKCGPSDIIQDGKNGFLVEQGNIEVMSEKLSTLIFDKELRKGMGKASLEKSSFYNEDFIMKKWMDLFNLLNPEK